MSAAFAGAGAMGAVTAPARMRTVTRKVPTPFGAHYAHVSIDDAGTVREVAISTPGKHHETGMHEAMIAIGEAITDCLPGGAADDAGVAA